MKSLNTQLTDIFQTAFETAGFERVAGVVTVSDRPDLADFQCNGALKVAKQASKNPREVAQQIADAITTLNNPLIESMTVEGPGFLNIRVQSAALAQQVNEQIIDSHFGVATAAEPLNMTIDYGGMNAAKPMHVGHLRSLVIGDSLKRIFRFLGHTVVGDVHLGDWGTQMGMIITQLEREQPQLPYFNKNFTDEYPAESPVTMADLDRIYPEASTLCKEDSEEGKAAMAKALQATQELQNGRRGYVALWQHIARVSLEELQRDVALLGIEFELWNGESAYHEWAGQMIERLQAAGFATESRNALIIDELQTPDDKKDIPPLLLTKSDGAYLYGTTDLACIDQRVQELKQEFLLYIVDERQSLHFEQVFRAAHKTGIAPENVTLTHAGFGTVNGKDGKPFKTRSGKAMKLNVLIDEVIAATQKQMEQVNVGRDFSDAEREQVAQTVAVSSLKFADLMNDRLASYIFDIDAFTQFEGKTGAYILYAAVRMQSILKKAEEQGIVIAEQVIDASRYSNATGQKAIRELQLLITQFPEIIERTARDFTPHVLANYAYDLANQFHAFYTHCPILKQTDPTLQLGLLSQVRATHEQLICSLNLLGMGAPEKM
jgi:arginyl-tRNA synthetase